jgi:hypothetical protein
MTAWVAYALGVTTTTAADYTRGAGAAPPAAIAAALREGRLCFEQVRALTRVATTATESQLIEAAAGLTATQVERLVRGLRPITAEEAAEAHRRRCLRLRWNDQDHTLRLYGRLPDVDGATVAAVIERMADQAAPPGHDPETEPFTARCADALVELASCALAADAPPDRPLVVVHIDAGALPAGEGGVATLECGPPVAADTARRLACDGRLQTVVEGRGGAPLGIGRRSRTVPPTLLRLLRHRDGGCTFPGCTRTRWVHAHHLRHWADGGPTDLDNLVLLCGTHHRFVHEGGWRVESGAGVRVRVFNPQGDRLRVGPLGLRPGVGRWMTTIPWLCRWTRSAAAPP